MARPIMRRKTEPFDLVPANPVTLLDDRLELVYFEKGANGEVIIHENEPVEAPTPKRKRGPRKRKAEAIPAEKSVSEDFEMENIMAGLNSGEISE